MQKHLLTMLLLILPLCEILAQTAEEKGLQIAVEADRRDSGWHDQQADFRMILKNKHGQESIRELRIRTMEVENDGDKSLTIFDTPPDIKGTAFLSFTHALEPDDQWLYLPALKRVKRIASANKSGPFMGSEFAYEDLTSNEVEKYTYKWLRDDNLDGQKTFVIERVPAYRYSGYTRQVAWISQTMYRPLKVEYFDRKNKLLKTLTFSGYEQYIDQYWRAGRMHMINHQTEKETILEWNNYRFNNGFTDRDFDKDTLKRAR